MQLVEQHVISKHDQRYSVIDAAAFASKNLYNAALYEMRQAFFNDGIYLNYNQIQRRMQSHEAYKALPAKVSQQILMLLDKNWTSFKEAKKAYKASFVDLDPIPTYKSNDDTEYIFSGKRIGRRNRLYRTKDGRKICADVNGSYKILRKSKPDAFVNAGAKGIAAYVVQPIRLAITV